MVPRVDLRLFERDRAEMHAGIDGEALNLARPPLAAIIERERADHPSAARLDRTGPAGLETKRLDQRAVVLPQRIGGDVLDHDRLAAKRRRAARAGHRADGKAVQSRRVARREARRRDGMEDAVLVHRKNGADRLRRKLLDSLAQARRRRNAARRRRSSPEFVLDRLQSVIVCGGCHPAPADRDCHSSNRSLTIPFVSCFNFEVSPSACRLCWAEEPVLELRQLFNICLK